MLAGTASGILGSIAGIILVYVAGVAAIFMSVDEVLPALLAAITYLPLMLILIFFVPNLVLGAMIGLLLAASRQRRRLFVLAGGALIGGAVAEVVLSLVLPLIVPPQPGDFVSIATNRYLTGLYGLVLGLVTGCFFAWMTGIGLAINRNLK